MPGFEPTWEAISWILIGITAWLAFLLISGGRYWRDVTGLESISMVVWGAAYLFAGFGGWLVWRISGWSTHLTALLMLVISIVVSLLGHIFYHNKTLVRLEKGGKMVIYPFMHWGQAIIIVALFTAIISVISSWRADMTGGALVLVYAILIALGVVVYYFHSDRIEKQVEVMTGTSRSAQRQEQPMQRESEEMDTTVESVNNYYQTQSPHFMGNSPTQQQYGGAIGNQAQYRAPRNNIPYVQLSK